jgi:hypothetical protein
MKTRRSWCFVPLFAFALWPCPAVANLIQNGDFETGDLGHWTVIGTPTTAWADVTTISPHSGMYDAELYTFSGNPQPVVGLQQVLNRPTTALTLTFWLKNDGGETGGETSVFDVLWDNVRVFHLTNQDTDLNYHMYTVTLPLDQSEAGILQFNAIQNPTEWHLDDINAVTARSTPEPSTLVLALSCSLGLLFLRRPFRAGITSQCCLSAASVSRSSGVSP